MKVSGIAVPVIAPEQLYTKYPLYVIVQNCCALAACDEHLPCFNCLYTKVVLFEKVARKYWAKEKNEKE